MLALYEENNKLLPSRDRRPPALLNKIFATTSFWSRCYKCIQFYSPLRPTQPARQLIALSTPRPGRPTRRRGSLSQPLYFKAVVYFQNCWIKQSQKIWQRKINLSLPHYQNLFRQDSKMLVLAEHLLAFPSLAACMPLQPTHHLIFLEKPGSLACKWQWLGISKVGKQCFKSLPASFLSSTRSLGRSIPCSATQDAELPNPFSTGFQKVTTTGKHVLQRFCSL